MGKAMLKWLLDTFKHMEKEIGAKSCDSIVLIYNPKFLTMERNMKDLVDYFSHDFESVKLVRLPGSTWWGACTYGDCFYTANIVTRFRKISRDFGATIVFHDTQPKPIFSYVKVDESMGVTDIIEKVKIWWGHNSKSSRETEVIGHNSEFYTSGVIKSMLQGKVPFKAILVEKTDFAVLGTPQQVRDFCDNRIEKSTTKNMPAYRHLNHHTIFALSPCIQSQYDIVGEITPRRFCVDLDSMFTSPQRQRRAGIEDEEEEGVMTTTTTSKGCCYDQCEPVSRVVEFIKSRYAEGHYIIIMSDRGVKEAKGNSYLANRLHAETSLRQLRANGIAYHEIWLGKPYADFYIDDKAVNALDNLSKVTGYYPHSKAEALHGTNRIVSRKEGCCDSPTSVVCGVVKTVAVAAGTFGLAAAAIWALVLRRRRLRQSWLTTRQLICCTHASMGSKAQQMQMRRLWQHMVEGKSASQSILVVDRALKKETKKECKLKFWTKLSKGSNEAKRPPPRAGGARGGGDVWISASAHQIRMRQVGFESRCPGDFVHELPGESDENWSEKQNFGEFSRFDSSMLGYMHILRTSDHFSVNYMRIAISDKDIFAFVSPLSALGVFRYVVPWNDKKNRVAIVTCDLRNMKTHVYCTVDCGGAQMNLWLHLVVFLLRIHFASGQCYLTGDSGENCAVCWKTVSGTTTLGTCPSSIETKWVTPVPENLYAGESYQLQYRLYVNQSIYNIIPSTTPSGSYDIAHVNIHSCINSRGACTPFVANSPGLATHTAAQQTNLQSNGYTTVESKVRLNDEKYTIIAHFRFFTPDTSVANYTTACDGGMCKVKYDVAMGVRRNVQGKKHQTSLGAFILAGIIGGLLILIMGSLFYASMTKKIDMANLLRSIFSEPVCILCNTFLMYSSLISYTLSFVNLVLVDNALVDVKPIAWFFLFASWTASLAIAYNSTRLLITSLKKIQNRRHFAHVVCRKFYETNGKRAKLAKRRSMALINSPDGVGAVLDYYKNLKKYSILWINLAGLMLLALPISAIQAYCLMYSSQGVQPVTVLALLFSAVIIGTKISSVSSIGESKRELAKSRKVLKSFPELSPLNYSSKVEEVSQNHPTPPSRKASKLFGQEIELKGSDTPGSGSRTLADTKSPRRLQAESIRSPRSSAYSAGNNLKNELKPIIPTAKTAPTALGKTNHNKKMKLISMMGEEASKII
eukprot:jgi/Bigna1/72846/fgenesh1_pg.21_\